MKEDELNNLKQAIEDRGQIDVESEVGKGTTFTIKIPIEESGMRDDAVLFVVDEVNIQRAFVRELHAEPFDSDRRER